MLETLTTKDIAKDLKKSKRTIQRLMESGKLPAISEPCRSGNIRIN